MTEREIFTEALIRASVPERAAFLDEACGQDPALRRRVEDLLAHHENGRPLLERRPADLLDALAATHRRDDSPPADVLEQLVAILGPSQRPGALGRLGHYDVLEVLGQGGCGIVVKAFDDSLHRAVAVKLLAPHLATTSPPRKRFLREARAVAQVKHENVVQVYAVEEQPVPYLVMEFVEGQTLQDRLDQMGPLNPAEVVRLGGQIAWGLAAAHEKGLIHRDVKPANILLEAGVEPRAKLTDFGLARAADDASLTQSGVIAGTPLYMAPEQVNGGVLDARADLFSLGSVLYTMTAGRPAFRAPNSFAVFKRVAEDAPRPLREVIGEVPPGLVAVIMKLLAKRPIDRFATAMEAADALAVCLTAPAPARSGRRLRWAAWVAGAVVLVAVGAWAAPQLAGPRGLGVSPDFPVAETPAPAAGVIVTRDMDDGSPGTLRWAVNEANSRPGEHTIAFAPSLAGRTIRLTAVGDATAGRSAMAITTAITIQGPTGDAGVTLAGGGRASNLRAFYVAPTGRLTLQNLTVRDFRHKGGDGGHGGGAAGMGGAVFNNGGTLIVLGSTFVGNTAQGGAGAGGAGAGGGGGLGGDSPSGQSPHDNGGGPNGGVASQVEGGFGGGGFGNVVGAAGGFGGGGGYADREGGPGGPGGFGGGGGSGGAFTERGNRGGFGGGAAAGGGGGGGGGAGLGGAVFANGGTTSFTNSTFTANTAAGGAGFVAGNGYGGAVFVRNSTLTVSGCTLAGNRADQGGGAVYAVSDANTGPGFGGGSAAASVTNSILVGTPNGASDVGSDAVAFPLPPAPPTAPALGGSGNLVQSNGPGGLPKAAFSAADPQLGPLGRYGGPTDTFALRPGSPAIDAGDNVRVPAGVRTDQRGVPRVSNNRVDIGAFEGQ